jgi:hypothetical protein
MGIHFPELKDIDKPVVWVFPGVLVCLDCGTAEFVVAEAELRQLSVCRYFRVREQSPFGWKHPHQPNRSRQIA